MEEKAGDELATYHLSLLRQYEIILDHHHESLALAQVPRPEAAYALLAAFDSFELVFATIEMSNDVAGAQKKKNLEEGLCQAFRWTYSPSAQDDLSATSSAATIEDAGEFIHLAGSYVNIADFHKMHGRGLVDVAVDPKSKHVLFVPKAGNDPIGALAGFAEDVEVLKRLPPSRDRAKTSRLAHACLERVSKAPFHLVSVLRRIGP